MFFFFSHEDMLSILEKRVANKNRGNYSDIMAEIQTSGFQDGLRSISRGLPHVESLLKIVKDADDLTLLDIQIMTT